MNIHIERPNLISLTEFRHISKRFSTFSDFLFTDAKLKTWTFFRLWNLHRLKCDNKVSDAS